MRPLWVAGRLGWAARAWLRPQERPEDLAASEPRWHTTHPQPEWNEWPAGAAASQRLRSSSWGVPHRSVVVIFIANVRYDECAMPGSVLELTIDT